MRRLIHLCFFFGQTLSAGVISGSYRFQELENQNAIRQISLTDGFFSFTFLATANRFTGDPTFTGTFTGPVVSQTSLFPRGGDVSAILPDGLALTAGADPFCVAGSGSVSFHSATSGGMLERLPFQLERWSANLAVMGGMINIPYRPCMDVPAMPTGFWVQSFDGLGIFSSASGTIGVALNMTFGPVPEPATGMLLMVGLVACGVKSKWLRRVTGGHRDPF